MHTESLTQEEFTALQSFKQNLNNSFGEEVRFVYLFGSKARGDSHKNSDIDLLVVTKSDDWRLGDKIRRIGYALDEDIEFKFSILVIPELQFQYQQNKQFQFIQNVLRDGVKL